MPYSEPDLFATKPKVLSVGELTLRIKHLLEEEFAQVTVRGEISQARPASSGHLYLKLKDEQAILPCVMWRGDAARLKFQLPDGLAVVARGALSVYPPHGSYQLVIKELEPVGQGALELAFRQLKEKLEKRGWFAAERKRPLPRFPQRLAIVTAAGGAALRDMLKILKSRWPAVEVLLVPVQVQGDKAAPEIARAIRLLNQLAEPPDVMIVGRGGGSLEDLWAFNEEVVAQAIFESRIPVISAVGHEPDVTIADFVADRRAATPTEAATFVVPDRQEILRWAGQQGQRLGHLLRRCVTLARQRIDSLARRRYFTHPLERVANLRQQLDDLAGDATQALARRRQVEVKHLGSLAARLESLSPLKVLARGYSLTENALTGERLRTAEQVRVGDPLRIRLAVGQLLSRVEEVRP